MMLYEKNAYVLDGEYLSDAEKSIFDRMRSGMSEEDATWALYRLSDYLYRYHGKKVMILLDVNTQGLTPLWFDWNSLLMEIICCG